MEVLTIIVMYWRAGLASGARDRAGRTKVAIAAERGGPTMSTRSRGHVADIVSVDEVRNSKCQRLARQFLFSALPVPNLPKVPRRGQLVAFYGTVDGYLDFGVDPHLSDFEREVAAWGCAIRMQKSGDDAWGLTRQLLRNTIKIIELAGPNVRQLFRAQALGMTQTLSEPTPLRVV